MNKIIFLSNLKTASLYLVNTILIMAALILAIPSLSMITISPAEIMGWHFDEYEPWYVFITGYNTAAIFFFGWLLFAIAFACFYSSINIFFKIKKFI